MTNLSGEMNYSPAQSIYQALRIASAMCFIGHGAFGIITKPIWCNYFAIAGIGHDLAYRLMPLVGSMDILCGLVLLFFPIRGVAAWLVIWGLITASMRPLSGEPFAEMIERAGNFGAPLALLLLSQAGAPKKGWLLSKLSAQVEPDARHMRQMLLCLRIVVVLLLVGHGWLNLIEKKGLLTQYQSLGFSNPVQVAQIAGIFELVSALAVLVKPVRPLLLVFFIWKMGTELFYPKWEFFEWIERGGSYGCILALWIALGVFPTRATQPKSKLAI